MSADRLGPAGHRSPVIPRPPVRGRWYRLPQQLSAPLRDRIDLEVAVPRQSPDRLVGTTAGESSAAVRARVEAARPLAALRRGPRAGEVTGGQAWQAEIRPSPAALGLVRSAAQRLGLSARALFGVLRVARTTADLAAAVVVVEATDRSGALSTAGWAADLGRDVLAVPGSIRSDTAASGATG